MFLKSRVRARARASTGPQASGVFLKSRVRARARVRTGPRDRLPTVHYRWPRLERTVDARFVQVAVDAANAGPRGAHRGIYEGVVFGAGLRQKPPVFQEG